MSVTLHGAARSTYTWSARLALAEKGVAFDAVPARLGTPEYGALHPFHKMPALDHDGFVVYEAAAVMRYVDEGFDGPALQPADPRGRARMMQWLSAFNDYVGPTAVRGVLIPRFVLAPRGIPADDAKVHAAAVAAHRALTVFDAALAGTPYLAGEGVSLADFLLVPVIAYQRITEGADRYTDDLPHIAAWFGRMAERPSFAATAAPRGA